MGLISDPSYFLDDPAVANRAPEVPDASFDNGCNAAASNACGIGIGEGVAALSGQPQHFTLLDQRGNARTPQTSQMIGGDGYTDIANYPSSGGSEGTAPDSTIRFGTSDAEGVTTASGNAHLADLAVGWVAVP